MNKKYFIILIAAVATVVACFIFAFRLGGSLATDQATEQINKITEDLSEKLQLLDTTKNELFATQEELRLEIETSSQLNKLLDQANMELHTANTIITELKNEEHELVYMGDFRYTYYCNEPYEHICGYGLGITASGKPTEVGWTVAADTSVLPMGSIIYIEGIGFREVEDVGGAVNGRHIDILLDTHSECFEQTLVNGGVWVLVKKGY